MIKYIFIISISFLLMGCQGACTAEHVAGIRLGVTVPGTGGNPCGLNIMIIDGDYIEELVLPDNCDVAGSFTYQRSFAFERAGTYQIIISKEGYQTWEVEDFVVDRDFCHVITRSLEVELVKL
jgi:hypothetical protein